MRQILIALCAATIVADGTDHAAAQGPTAWKAGVSAVKITPPGPIWPRIATATP